LLVAALRERARRGRKRRGEYGERDIAMFRAVQSLKRRLTRPNG
jgi:hypothetical protein